MAVNMNGVSFILKLFSISCIIQSAYSRQNVTQIEGPT